VLSFEGERSHQYRILRAVKNRFGGTDEIGVFAMVAEGLVEVSNPSALFLTERRDGVAGATVFPAMEGTRPVLVEIQALVVRLASGATPRRAVVGWESSASPARWCRPRIARAHRAWRSPVSARSARWSITCSVADRRGQSENPAFNFIAMHPRGTGLRNF
jgi:hypothetical protein